MFIHKFDVDSDRVYRELAQSEQHQGAILFYSSFEFVLSQALSSVSLLLSALLLFLGIAFSVVELRWSL